MTRRIAPAPWRFLAALLAAVTLTGYAVPHAQAGLLVASRFTDGVLHYDGTTGAFIGTFATGGGLDSPAGLTFGPDGNLYVASGGTGNVKRYDGTTGAFIDTFISAVIPELTLLTFGPDGNLYVIGGVSSEVLRYDGTTGAFIDTFASGGGLNRPWGLVFGPDGNLYVSSRLTDNVLRYNGTTGAFIDTFASGGGLNNPYGLVFTPEAAAVPEPSSAMLLGLGGLAFAGRLLRRRKFVAAHTGAARLDH